jgi:hypothetical protein
MGSIVGLVPGYGMFHAFYLLDCQAGGQAGVLWVPEGNYCVVCVWFKDCPFSGIECICV